METDLGRSSLPQRRGPSPWRATLPALAELAGARRLPGGAYIVGVGRELSDDKAFRLHPVEPGTPMPA